MGIAVSGYLIVLNNNPEGELLLQGNTVIPGRVNNHPMMACHWRNSNPKQQCILTNAPSIITLSILPPPHPPARTHTHTHCGVVNVCNNGNSAE